MIESSRYGYHQINLGTTGREMAEQTRFCDECGARFERSSSKFCTSCGTEIPSTSGQQRIQGSNVLKGETLT